tara:strand:- start:539 stop:796 length:258 start_codon:yes stop_codon:yes gene_type:complete
MMPRYTYECISCEKSFDVVHHYKHVETECKFCKSIDIKRLINKVFIYKKTDTNEKAGTKIKETISETVKEMERYKKQSTRERDIK